ncbi:MAG: thiamine pyrophosphate-dependent enzyme [Chloroflexi bacterium]|nr:thiamine pyrophosphate-dependent enzyme [Chloroflexota bacterium]
MKTKVERAIARVLIDNKLDLITWTPALGVSEVLSAFEDFSKNKVPYSFNEETAWSIAHGAAMYGGYAVSIMKTHGVLKAANAISDSLFAELTGGLVLIVVDDIAGTRSDSIIFGEKILTGLEMPFVKADKGTICESINTALDRSHNMKIPYAIIIDTSEILNQYTLLKTTNVDRKRDSFIRCPERKVICPMLTSYQRKIFEARISGNDPDSITTCKIPVIPEDIPAYWHPAIERYSPLMKAIQSIKTVDTLITSDIGFFVSFAFPPFYVQDMCTFMGAGTSLAIGAAKAGSLKNWAITGDFSFIGAGHLALLEPGVLNLPVKVAIMANLVAETTGGQSIDKEYLDRTLKIVEERVVHVENSTDEVICKKALLKAESEPGLRIVVFHYRI